MNTKLIKIFLALTIFLGSSCYIFASEVMFNNGSNDFISNDESKIVYKKNKNETLLIPENANELTGLGSGPFIRLKNGQIFTVTAGMNASVSNDNGKTWTHYTILDKKANDISSPVFIETKDGVIVLAYVNLKEKFWDWDKNILDAPNAVLPTYTTRSYDGGKTWQDNQKLHDDWTGMIRSIIETREGNVVFTTMKLKHNPGSHVVLTYTSGDNGATWKQSNILACYTCSGDHSGLMESTIVQLNNGKLWQLIRTNWGYFEESFSSDQGITWSNPQKTDIDASTAPAALTRLASGRLILVWNREYPEGKSSYPLIGGKENPNLSEAPTSWQREELSMAFSDDDGKNWTSPVVVAKVYKDDSYVFEQWNTRRWLSYPQVFEVSPGKIWVTTDFGGVRLEVNEKDFTKPLFEKGYKPTADTKILLKDGVEELRDVKGGGPYIRLNNNKNTSQKEEFALEDKSKIKSIFEGKEPIKWVFTGNSITQGAKHTHGMRAYPEIFAERIRWEMQRPYDFIINTAISGHTTQNLINDFNKRISEFNPKVVVLMIGTNDAAKDRSISIDIFGNNLIELIDKIRGFGAIPIVLSPTTIITEKNPERSSLYLYVERMEEIVKIKNVIYVDNWTIWSTELQQKYTNGVYKELMNDPLHPNGYGHQEIAMALFKALSIFDPTAPTCGGSYYEGYH